MGSPSGSRCFVLASGNPGKLREVQGILGRDEVLPLSAFAGIVFPEEGDDYGVNALAKAVTVLEATGLASLADDSGLEVDALGGRPGVRSARYGGPELDDRGRLECLLRELAMHPDPLLARFVCIAACALPDGRRLTACGVCEGEIIRTARGASGFGYDPIFVPRGHARTCAELARDEKDRISHRGHAFRALAHQLESGDRERWL